MTKKQFSETVRRLLHNDAKIPAAVANRIGKQIIDAAYPTPRAITTVDLAVEKAGGATALARALGVTPQSVWDWLVKGYVPLARAKEIEMQFGIPRNDLVSPKVRSSMGVGGEL